MIITKTKSLKIDKENPAPVWKQLAEGLKDHISSNNITGGTKLPSLRKLGKELSISYLTVSKAVNHLVSESILETKNGSGIYVCENRKTLPKKIGILLGHSKNYMCMRYLHGVNMELENLDIELVSYTYSDIESIQRHLINLQKNNSVEGVILYSSIAYANPILLQALSAEMPIVILNTPEVTAYKADACVYSDDETGMKMIVDALKKKKHQEVYYFAGPDENPVIKLRKDSFTFRAAENNLNVQICENINSADTAYLNTMRLFVEKKKFTAIVCWNDVVACGVMRYCNSQGIRIPDDIAVTGYGNLDLAEHTYPRLTSIEQHFDEMGKLAVRQLLKSAKKRSCEKPVNIKVPVELIPRESL